MDTNRYAAAQGIAKDAIRELSGRARAGMTIAGMEMLAEKAMLDRGATGFWYHGIPAMIFSGNETRLFSKEQYNDADKGKALQENDIFWIDLAPEKDGAWGDLTRTLVMRRGRVLKKEQLDDYRDDPDVGEYARLVLLAEDIQEKILERITPDMDFGDVFELTRSLIEENRCTCPDTRSNFGHDLPGDLDRRNFIVRGDATPVRGTVFAHEFQIMKGHASARIEDVFYFEKNRLIRL